MIVYLEPSTWAGLSIDAEHWFGDLRCGDRRVRLNHAMNAAEAQDYNRKHHDCGYRAGTVTESFATVESLRSHAVAVFLEHFPQARLLVEGKNSLYPGPVLFGPPEVQQHALALYDRMEALYAGRSEPRSWQEHDNILDEWEALIKPFAS